MDSLGEIKNRKSKEEMSELDFSQVFGQETAKRAALLAAAGGHDMLMMGSPGVGKSMIARRLPGLLPAMTYEECREVTKITASPGCWTGKGLRYLKGLSENPTQRQQSRPYWRRS